MAPQQRGASTTTPNNVAPKQLPQQRGASTATPNNVAPREVHALGRASSYNIIHIILFNDGNVNTKHVSKLRLQLDCWRTMRVCCTHLVTGELAYFAHAQYFWTFEDFSANSHLWVGSEEGEPANGRQTTTGLSTNIIRPYIWDITISGAKEVSRDFGFSSFLGYIDVRGRLRGFDFIGRLSPRCRKQSYVRVHRPHGSNRPKTIISIGHVTNSVFCP